MHVTAELNVMVHNPAVEEPFKDDADRGDWVYERF